MRDCEAELTFPNRPGLNFAYITVGSQSGHSRVTVGSQLGHSWVICFIRKSGYGTIPQALLSIIEIGYCVARRVSYKNI